jgi:putative thioredoxin
MDFQADVLQRSHQIPVVVDFWAPWCGPCQVLGPVIESLAQEQIGKWELVKVNTETHPKLAQEYRIKGIPSVKMLYEGQVVAEFSGALPKYQIALWLTQNLPDPRVQLLHAVLEKNDLQVLESFVAQHPDLELGRFELAWALLGSQPFRSVELLKSVEGNPTYSDLAQNAKALAEMNMGATPSGIPQVVGPIDRARTAFLANDIDQCLHQLVLSIMADKTYGNELARRACLAIFNRLGEGHDGVKKYRRRFNMALY